MHVFYIIATRSFLLCLQPKYSAYRKLSFGRGALAYSNSCPVCAPLLLQPKYSAYREPSFGHGTLDLLDATHGDGARADKIKGRRMTAFQLAQVLAKAMQYVLISRKPVRLGFKADPPLPQSLGKYMTRGFYFTAGPLPGGKLYARIDNGKFRMKKTGRSLELELSRGQVVGTFDGTMGAAGRTLLLVLLKSMHLVAGDRLPKRISYSVGGPTHHADSPTPPLEPILLAALRLHFTTLEQTPIDFPPVIWW